MLDVTLVKLGHYVVKIGIHRQYYCITDVGSVHCEQSLRFSQAWTHHSTHSD